MRRINSIITILIIGLFVYHLIYGGMILAGMIKGGGAVSGFISRLLLVLIAVHVCIAVILTVSAIRAISRSGVFYARQNMFFILRRISGFALMIFIVVHVLLFSGDYSQGAYRLKPFGTLDLIGQILMIISLLVHVATNIRPLMISLGISDRSNVKTDVLLVMSGLLVLAGIAFAVYYLRWLKI